MRNTLKENQAVSSYSQEEIGKNYFLNVDVDYLDKIIASGLVRYDQSSLFGSENRSRVYGRGTLAYIISEDYQINGIDFFLRNAAQEVPVRPKPIIKFV